MNMNFNRYSEKIKMPRLMMAALVLAVGVLPAHAAGTYEASVAARYIDLDFRGSRGQVQEYDGKLYRGAHGDISLSNQASEGLLDFSITDIGSTEENVSLNLDHKSGLRASGKYQAMHHRLNYIRVGELHDGIWIPKQAITLRGVSETQELVMRRTESEFNFGFISPENSARYIMAQYWGTEKVGSMSWSYTGNPNIQRTAAPVDNTKLDFTLGAGTNIKEDGALNLDFVRSEFIDAAQTLPALVDGGTGSSNNGGVIKRQNGRQNMTGAEFQFRKNVGKNLSVTGALTGRQRENLHTQYKNNAAVGSLNASYRISKKASLLAKLYLRANMVDEDKGYFPAASNANAVQYLNVNTHQMDMTTARGEFIANFRPVEKVNLKAAYKLEITNRRDAPTQVYSSPRYYSDGYVVNAPWDNSTAHNDTKHTGTLSAKIGLPLGIEAEAAYKKFQANRPAFVNMANHADEANGSLSVPLPLYLDMSLEAGYLREKNTITQYTQYSQTRNTYRAGLDWSGSDVGFFGADISYETIRYFSELYFGSGNADGTTPLTAAYHASTMNRLLNTVYGVHGKVICPKGFVVSGNGSYTRSTVTTPISYTYGSGAGTVTDFTPSNVNIARGSVAVEYTPEKFKSLTARASYSVSDWVDKYDELNSGRASVAQLGAAMKF
jgi:hypothetical protein